MHATHWPPARAYFVPCCLVTPPHYLYAMLFYTPNSPLFPPATSFPSGLFPLLNNVHFSGQKIGTLGGDYFIREIFYFPHRVGWDFIWFPKSDPQGGRFIVWEGVLYLGRMHYLGGGLPHPPRECQSAAFLVAGGWTPLPPLTLGGR